jgi:hypothetical protein
VRREADHLPPFSTEVKMVKNNRAVPPRPQIFMTQGQLHLFLPFTGVYICSINTAH